MDKEGGDHSNGSGCAAPPQQRFLQHHKFAFQVPVSQLSSNDVSSNTDVNHSPVYWYICTDIHSTLTSIS